MGLQFSGFCITRPTYLLQQQYKL
uniref:Uncharacterized protein n=1 Tax=Anguilla anguilla TaxID=7936 RepID=A0A0E9VKV6_ANGAN